MHHTPTIASLLGAATLAFGACGGPQTGPTPPQFANAAAVSAAVHSLDSAFGGSVLHSYFATAPLLTTAPPPSPSQVAATASATCAPPAAGALTPLFSPSAPLPPQALQHVFAWDIASAWYAMTSDMSGPADGVRFLLYATDQGNIAFPLATLGWFDMVSSGGGVPPIVANVSDGSATVAAYSAAVTGTMSAYQADLSGTTANGGYAVSWRDSITFVGSQTTVAGTVDAANGVAHVALRAMRNVADAFDNYYSVDVALRQGSDTVRVAGTIVTYCLIPTTNLTLTVDSRVFAQVTNDSHGLVFARWDGGQVTAEQGQAVQDLLDGAKGWFADLVAFLAPARALL